MLGFVSFNSLFGGLAFGRPFMTVGPAHALFRTSPDRRAVTAPARRSLQRRTTGSENAIPPTSERSTNQAQLTLLTFHRPRRYASTATKMNASAMNAAATG